MLSSAASAQAPEASSVPGFRIGASSSAMMTGAPSWAVNADTPRENGQQSSGLTPFLSYNDTPAIDNAATSGSFREQSLADPYMGSDVPRRSSPYSMSRPTFGMNSNCLPSGQSVLSPNNVFNFSPGPSGPTATGTTQPNLEWAPPCDKFGQIHPSTRVAGAWRSIETVDTVLQDLGQGPTAPLKADTAANGIFVPPADVEVDMGFPPVDEAMQQQLLMDLFWPGWPPCLPEPHIVNDL